MGAPATKRLSYDDYLALERETDVRHEFLDGEVRAMAGGTLRHSRLKVKLVAALEAILGDGPCQVYDSDAKVVIAEENMATYPDLAVICGPPEVHAQDRNAATNPRVLVEVLGEGTESWDRGGKFRRYRALDSLRTYVLVDQDEPVIEVFERDEEGGWTLHTFRAGQRLPLPAIDAELDLDALYRNLPPKPDAREAD